MFDGVLSFLESNLPSVFDFIGEILTGGIGLIWDDSAAELTQLGELTLLGAAVGLAFFGLRWIRSMIPFMR